MDHLFSSRKGLFLWLSGVALILLLVYGWSLTNDFVVWDDALLVTQNPTAHGLTWTNIVRAFTTYDPELYIPLTLLSFQLNYTLHELHPFGYHLVNLLLHFGSVLMVAWVMFAITKNRTAAIITALLFAIHPINVEAVAWVSGRKDVLAAFFFLLSIGAFLTRERHPERVEGWLWYAASAVLFALGLMAKVSIALLPLILLLVDWYRQKPITKKTWMELIPFFALSILFVIVAGLGKSSTDEFFWEKILMGARSIALHLIHLVYPVGFSVLYPYTQPLSILTPDILLSMLFVIALIVGAIMARIKWKVRSPIFALAWFLVLLAPSMTNIAKGHNELLDVYITSDRYAYLPVIGIFLLCGLGYAWIKERITQASGMNFTAFGGVSRLGNLLLIVIIIFLGYLSFDLSRTWYDTTSLFSQTIKHHKNAYVAYTNIGTELYKLGQVDAALQYFYKSLSIRTDATTLFNVGVIEREQGNTQKALEHFLAAAQSSMVDPAPRIAVTSMLIQDGQWENAQSYLEQSILETRPSAHLHQLLGFVLEERGKIADAKVAYRKALELDPQNSPALQRLEALGG